MTYSASPRSVTRSRSPQITCFPRTPIVPLRKTRPDLYHSIERSRRKAKGQSSRRYKEDDRFDLKDPGSYRAILRSRLMKQLCWDGPFCSQVFAEELRDRLGSRYTVENHKRKLGDAYWDGARKAFETTLDLEILNMRLEIAALERAKGQKLKEKFVVLGKYNDEGMFGQYVPAQPTLPAKPPSSPVERKMKAEPEPEPSLRYRARQGKGRRINGLWAEMHGGQIKDRDVKSSSGSLPEYDDDCVVS